MRDTKDFSGVLKEGVVGRRLRGGGNCVLLCRAGRGVLAGLVLLGGVLRHHWALQSVAQGPAKPRPEAVASHTSVAAACSLQPRGAMRPARSVSSKNDPQAFRSAAPPFRQWRREHPCAQMIVGCRADNPKAPPSPQGTRRRGVFPGVGRGAAGLVGARRRWRAVEVARRLSSAPATFRAACCASALRSSGSNAGRVPAAAPRAADPPGRGRSGSGRRSPRACVPAGGRAGTSVTARD